MRKFLRFTTLMLFCTLVFGCGCKKDEPATGTTSIQKPALQVAVNSFLPAT